MLGHRLRPPTTLLTNLKLTYSAQHLPLVRSLTRGNTMISSHVHDLDETSYQQLLPSSKKLEQRLIGAFNNYMQLATSDTSESMRQQIYQSILSACGGFTKSHRSFHLAKSLQALLLIDLGKAKEALLVARLGIDSESHSSQCWHALGHAHLRQQQYKNALSAFANAMRIDPKVITYRTSRAFTLLAMGNTLQAFNEYRALAIIAPNNIHIRTKLFECSRYIEPKSYSAQLEEFVLELLSCDEQDRTSIAPLCNKLLVRKYDLHNKTLTISLSQLEQDPLWHQTLRLSGLRNVTLERFIVEVRKHCIKDYAINGNLDHCEQTVRSIGELQISTNYLLPCPPNELLHLNSLLENDNSDATSPLLSMYVTCPTLGTDTHHQPSDSTVTERIRSQYELYPYPMWHGLPTVNKTSYSAALQLQGIEAPTYWANLSRPLRILIAGCGTGRHALAIAKYLSFVDVTAVDISSASLEYAAAKARELNVHNVRFIQRDLLAAPLNNDLFDVIECSGVLHHSDQPDLMLSNLRLQLVNGGLIKLGLYSQLARQQISEFRHQCKRVSSVHQARRIVKNNPVQYSHVIDSPDFWNTSGCVDLLLNQHEDCYSWPMIKKLLERNHLKLHGVSGVSENIKADVAQFAGEDLFDQWHQYELTHPKTFAAMYQFYVLES